MTKTAPKSRRPAPPVAPASLLQRQAQSLRRELRRDGDPTLPEVFAGLGRADAIAIIDEAIAAGAPHLVEGLDAWSQPGVFAWDRIDAGSALLAGTMPPLKGAGADLGCGYGALATVVLRSAAVTSLRLVDLDRRAVEAARRNVEDARASFDWADTRTLEAGDGLDFIVMNPPFHDGGAEDRRLGQAFIRKAAEMLKKGGVLWLVANRHLPYEAELKEAFKRVTPAGDGGPYKLFECVK